MFCKICSSQDVSFVGLYRPYLDYEAEIWDCKVCECRFAPRDPGIYEKLHSISNSPYSSHAELAIKVKDWFDKGEIEILYNFLIKNPKNRFIIENIVKFRTNCKILEFGCGKGYLTSYFISQGYNIIGTDISSAAVNWAREAFGDYFIELDNNNLKKNAPYDVIYHVGTIGCVESPIQFTNNLLSLLKREGLLLFNSPNIMSSKMIGNMWVDGTPPPDLVTLFEESFWENYFSDFAKVIVVNTNMTIDQCTKHYKNKLLKVLGLLKERKYLFPSTEEKYQYSNNRFSKMIISYFVKILYVSIKFICSIKLLKRLPSSFGIYVKMVKT